MSKYKIADFTLDPALEQFKQGVPFHGDQYLIDYIGKYMEHADYFIETGTNYGDTFYFIKQNFPDKNGMSCEPDTGKWPALEKMFNPPYQDYEIKNCGSLEMLNDFIRGSEHANQVAGNVVLPKTVFWLDAHGEWYENGEKKFSWPLHEEVDLITKNFKNYAIFIDDFANPYNPVAKFDVYGDRLCAAQEIHDVLNGAGLYHLVYDKVTSVPQPFIVGVGLVTDMEPLPTDNDMTVVRNDNPGIQYMLKPPEPKSRLIIT